MGCWGPGALFHPLTPTPSEAWVLLWTQLLGRRLEHLKWTQSVTQHNPLEHHWDYWLPLVSFSSMSGRLLPTQRTSATYLQQQWRNPWLNQQKHDLSTKNPKSSSIPNLLHPENGILRPRTPSWLLQFHTTLSLSTIPRPCRVTPSPNPVWFPLQIWWHSTKVSTLARLSLFLSASTLSCISYTHFSFCLAWSPILTLSTVSYTIFHKSPKSQF